MRLDLHGMRTKDAIELFIYEYNRAVRSGLDRMEVIHGYGSSGRGGDIKEALAALLDAHQSKVRYIRGESLGNRGATVVVPDKELPSRAMALDAVIGGMLSAKLVSLLAIEERLHGLASADEIRRSLSALAGKGLAAKVVAGGRMLYTRG